MSKNRYRIRKVVVLGSGVMGSQIAAHCVNAGLEVSLLDLKDSDADNPNRIAQENVDKLLKMNPAPLALKSMKKHIRVGNFEDHLNWIEDADWVVEAIVERMDIKRDMFERVEKYRTEGTIVSSNTSGLPISEISSETSDDFKAHFLGTHFFNPPRYMKLLEVIPTEHTDDAVTEYMTRFCERTLGKGVVPCKDTPNFIANRIGIFSTAVVFPYFFDGTFRAEEIDFLTGTLTGYSKAATFRTADMAGNDVINHVAENLLPAIPDDERQEVFDLPEGFKKMIEEGMHGNKAGKGFYKKVRTDKGKAYHVLNPESFEYESQQEVSFEVADQAKKECKGSRERLGYLVRQDGKAADFIWEVQKELLLYSANRVPEISDSVLAVDRAMKWGFNWELGPFERWDAIGVDYCVKRIEEEGGEVPANVKSMLESGREAFYDYEANTVYNLATGEVEAIDPPAEGALQISDLKRNEKQVFSNKSATLYDMGDGVALFEIHSKANTLGFEVVQSMFQAFEVVPEQFDAMVIGSQGDHFSVGANLMEAMQALQQGQIDEVQKAVKNFQDAVIGIRDLPIPVVLAPFGRTLGGACEFMMHADRVVAHHELYAGLVEIGVGLIPAGAGTKELLRRAMERVIDDEQADPLPFIKKVFKTIGMAEVSMGAPEAVEKQYLRDSDIIVMNKDLQLAMAKDVARTMADVGYQPPRTPEIKVMGKTGLSAIQLMLYIMEEAGWISGYDSEIAEKVAFVMSGGDLDEPQTVPESYLLKLERDAFMKLMGNEKTHDRVKHMLKKGKPLRN